MEIEPLAGDERAGSGGDAEERLLCVVESRGVDGVHLVVRQESHGIVAASENEPRRQGKRQFARWLYRHEHHPQNYYFYAEHDIKAFVC